MRRVLAWWNSIAGVHRSDDDTNRGTFFNFFFPRLTRGFFLRMGIVAAVAAILFGVVLMPCVIDGASMAPTYPVKGFTFCYKLRYWFEKPKRGDVVIIRFSGKTYYLKRIVGLPGETVEFRRGDLYINGSKLNEPYVKYFSDWNLAPREVEPDHYYVVGDNRSQPIEQHRFGKVRADRIVGSPLW